MLVDSISKCNIWDSPGEYSLTWSRQINIELFSMRASLHSKQQNAAQLNNILVYS